MMLRLRDAAIAWWVRFVHWWRYRSGWTVAVAMAVAYVPLLGSSPGLVGADTKTYLYLDPGRLMSQAGVMWDADRALGTVTHQNIGFLWPMGPFYWFFETLGAPDWVAQRLWLGTLLAAAGLGVRYLLRTLGFDGRGLLIAMLAYELGPYALHYSARISAVLLPWAGLGWMIGLTVRAARTGGWRHPALFALTVVTVGSVNATSLVLAGLGPVLWLVHAAVADRSISARRALAAAARIGVLTVAVSLWWMAGLAVQSRYSLNVLHYTETPESVAEASTAPEVLRSLGYWFFYGNDKLGAWIEPSVAYTQGGWLIFVGFGLAVLALGSAALVRWRHRSYFVLLVAVGALVAVGFHPPDDPSALGALFERYIRSGPGLALRSLPRAIPLVALGMAVLLGAGVNALGRRLPRLGAVAGVLVMAGVVLNNPAMWRIDMIEDNLNRPEELPAYWLEAADALDADDSRTRVWEVPGSDFASYRWGNTVDPITPGLIGRGYVARELVPFGSPQSASLLGALDRRLQEDTLDPASLAPVARLMSVGDVVHRADLIFERYRTPRPVETAEILDRAPGLQPTQAFGDPVPNVAGPQQTMIDEIHLARPADAAHPAPVTRYEVADPLPLLRTRPVAGATVLVGGADGIVTAAGAGVLELDRPLVYAADMAADESLAETVLSHPAHIVVTDANRRRAQLWRTLRENQGHTEQAYERAPHRRRDRQPHCRVRLRRGGGQRHRGRRRPHRQRAARPGRGPGHRLRQPGQLHQRRPALQRGRRIVGHGVVGGRLQRGPRRAAAAHPGRAGLRGGDAPSADPQPPRTAHRRDRAPHHRDRPADRRAPFRRCRAGPAVAVARGPDHRGRTHAVGDRDRDHCHEHRPPGQLCRRRAGRLRRGRPGPRPGAGGDPHAEGAAGPARRRPRRPPRDRRPNPGAVEPPRAGADRSGTADRAGRPAGGRTGGRGTRHCPSGRDRAVEADRLPGRDRSVGFGAGVGVVLGAPRGRSWKPGLGGARRRPGHRVDGPLRSPVRPVARAAQPGAIRRAAS